MQGLDFVDHSVIYSKEKIYLKTQMSLDFMFLQQIGIEAIKFLCTIVNQISKYLLGARSLQSPMINMEKYKSTTGHVPRELAYLICLKNSNLKTRFYAGL